MIFSQLSVAGTLALALGLFSQTASAVSVEKREIFVPPVLTPNADTFWWANRWYNVTWYVCAMGDSWDKP